jgi:phospholipid transport system substrate-binding protein
MNAMRARPRGGAADFLRVGFLAGALVAAVGWPGPAAAAMPAGAGRFVEALGTKVVEILKAPNIDLPEREKRFRSLFVSAFDAPTIGRFVLGRNWRTLNAAQRSKYLDLFNSYVAAIYATQFAHYQGQTFKVVDANAQEGSDTLVSTAINRAEGSPLDVKFRVRDEKGSFKIVDVAVEGVSLIITKRAEFASVIQREGFDGLMRRMNETLKKIQPAAL